ncbi:hypothetical protein DL96DRAFT_1610148, partial [Flagelloscypha sp. PMI_526]
MSSSSPSSRPPSTMPPSSQSGSSLRPSHRKILVGVLGATGTVGQRFIVLLSAHPWFVIHALGASSKSAGKKYVDATAWKQTTGIPSAVKEMNIRNCEVDDVWKECGVVFSGLDASVAGDIEIAFRDANIPVFSNAKNHRRNPLVPLVVPLANPSHLQILPLQQRNLSLSRGFIVTNANCSTTGLVIPLAALERAFGPLECVMVSTMQAISGGGYPGVPSLDILDNVVPYISGEEEKLEWETLKILGAVRPKSTTTKPPLSSSPSSDTITASDASSNLPDTLEFDMHSTHPLRVSASCSRVPVIDGHTETVSVRFARRPAPSPQQVREALVAFTPEARTLGCPSAPRKAIVVHEEMDRPQPRLDRYHQDGAGVSVGRVRQCQVLDIKFVVLANNVSIGAATSSIINAELAVVKGYVGGGEVSGEGLPGDD